MRWLDHILSIFANACAVGRVWKFLQVGRTRSATRKSASHSAPLRPHRPGAVKADSADDLVDGQGVIAGRSEQLGCPKLGGQLSDILSNIDFQSCWCNFELAT